MQNEINDGADAIRQSINRKATFAEAAILRELKESKRKSAELEERLQLVRAREDGLKNGTWSPVRLHVMFRQYGTTFAALSRAIQGAMCPGTKVAYIAWNHASMVLCRNRVLQMLKAYYGEDGFKNINAASGCFEISLPNGSSVKFLPKASTKYKPFVSDEYDRLIVDSVIINAKESPNLILDEYLDEYENVFESLIKPVLSSKDPQVDIYLQYEVRKDKFYANDGPIDPQLASPEYIKELLESRKDFGEGVKKGVIRWDLNRI